MKKLLEKAIQIAVNAHFGQKDEAGNPYIFHPLSVMNRCNTLEEKIVAILHDTIEDTNISPEILKEEGFPDYIIKAILAVTKQEGETYEDFVKRASKNPISCNVKIADIKDNLDVSRLSEVKEKEAARLNKYIKALEFLENKGV